MIPVLIPQPKSAEFKSQRAAIKKGRISNIVCTSSKVRQFVESLHLEGFDFDCQLAINCLTAVYPNLHDDSSYRLRINGSNIQIQSNTEIGALTACSTLAQMSANRDLTDCDIVDSPSHPWRGLLVDVSRRFIALETLRETVDLLHHFKLNVLHLHLTDDQAFRFPCERFPQMVADKHYTKNELKELIEYAADRGVRVVPEIDVPGHTTCWLVAYPHWGSEPVDSSSVHAFGAHQASLDPSNEEAVQGVIGVLEEVIDVFPDTYVHIGGDEVRHDWWTRSNTVQNWAGHLGLKSISDIQANFTCRIVDWLERQGRTAVVWDEALHPNLPQTVVVQTWRGVQARDVSLAAGFKTLVSSPYYLDLNYPSHVHFDYFPSMKTSDWESRDESNLELDIFGHVKSGLEWHRTFGEFPDLQSKAGGEILGGEACMWSELVSDELLHKRVWTRMPAIADRLWNDGLTKKPKHGYAHQQTATDRLSKLGLPDVAHPPIHACKELGSLFEMLEPVKWYARMLTPDGVESRAEGDELDLNARPYNTETRLDRVIDRLPPESPQVYECTKAVESGADLSDWIYGWRSQSSKFDKQAQNFPELEELRDASNALLQLAEVAEGKIDPDSALAGPFGEYMLPVAFAFKRLQHDS